MDSRHLLFIPRETKTMTGNLKYIKNLMLPVAAYVILTFTNTSGQTMADTSAVGTWMGTLEAGGVRLRLVLHIYRTETGTLTGTVDSPDKGIKGIPVSRVYANNDSLVVAIFSAQAGYEENIRTRKPELRVCGKRVEYEN
jgi:hypothetical protein